MTGAQRVSAAQVERLTGLLGPRDWRILEDLRRVRVLTGSQLDRLHFADIAPTARGRVRRRTMSQLVQRRAVTSLERRVGGVRAGSDGLIFCLDTAGTRVLERRQTATGQPAEGGRARRPRTPRPLFLAHALAGSDLYVSLRETERQTPGLTIEAFDAEPACWWPAGADNWLKPDAYVALATEQFIDHTWVEVDRATESLPTLHRKLLTYVSFVNRGGLGPGGVVPGVLVTVPDDARAELIRSAARRLPEPGPELVTVVLHDEAARLLTANIVPETTL
ncbi:conserved hypothetical protein [Frankia sp. Hr75.2]|nr:conserved hypothetical protein [Frankia sp. Hr75.2]